VFIVKINGPYIFKMKRISDINIILCFYIIYFTYINIHLVV